MTILRKDSDAFEHAFSLYADTVYRVAVHNCACNADAEEITQESFLRLLECRKIFQSDEHLKAWLIRVTINLCHNRTRSQKKEVLTDTLPESSAEDRDSTVLDAVRALPESQKNVIYLHYYEGYTAKEIGNILDMKENTVLSHLRRGRESLRASLGGFDNEAYRI